MSKEDKNTRRVHMDCCDGCKYMRHVYNLRTTDVIFCVENQIGHYCATDGEEIDYPVTTVCDWYVNMF